MDSDSSKRDSVKHLIYFGVLLTIIGTEFAYRTPLREASLRL